MSKVAVVYWSGTGNTQAMAEAVAQASQGTLLEASAFGAAQVEAFDKFAFGCPSMGAEELEDSEFEPMFTAVKPLLAGKTIALFGSYGWGDGEWMRIWEEDCRQAGAILATESVICQETPDADALAQCEALGKALLQ